MLKTSHYQISADNIMGHEIIGLNAVVKNSSDKSRKGIRGRIVNETMNTFIIETKNVEKSLPKKEISLEFDLGNERVEIDGKLLVARPEERTKLFWRKYHGRMQ